MSLDICLKSTYLVQKCVELIVQIKQKKNAGHSRCNVWPENSTVCIPTQHFSLPTGCWDCWPIPLTRFYQFNPVLWKIPPWAVQLYHKSALLTACAVATFTQSSQWDRTYVWYCAFPEFFIVEPQSPNHLKFNDTTKASSGLVVNSLLGFTTQEIFSHLSESKYVVKLNNIFRLKPISNISVAHNLLAGPSLLQKWWHCT